MNINRSSHGRFTRGVAGVAPILLAALTVGCGNLSEALLPAAPSPIPVAVASAGASSGATLSVMGKGNEKDKGKDGQRAPARGAAPTPAPAPAPSEEGDTELIPPTAGDDDGEAVAAPGRRATQLEGIVAEVSGLCPEVTLLVETPTLTQTVVVDTATEFQRGLCSQVSPGDRVHVSGRTELGVYVASIVRLQGPRKVGDDLEDPVEVDDDEEGDEAADDVVVPPVTPLPTAP